MKRVESFLFDRMDAPLLDGSGITPDPELVARNQERAKKIIEDMGRLWCCYLPPKHLFKKTYCPQCGGEFGPGDIGYSRCADHAEHDKEAA